MAENQQLTADPEIIRANIRRIWGTIQGAARKTGFSRQVFYNIIQDGEVTDCVAGRLFKLGVDPMELVKELK